MNDHPPITLLDYERRAVEKIARSYADYYNGGADDEVTVRENVTAYNQIFLRPRVLVDVSQRDLSVTVLGQTRPHPILIAPTALAGMAHPDAERGIARAAAATGTIFTLSTWANTAMEDIAPLIETWWFQLYPYKDRAITQRLIERAERAGCAALVITVDTPVAGKRLRDIGNQFAIPPALKLANLTEFDLDAVHDQANASAMAAYAAAQRDSSLSWRDIDWLRSITTLPIVVKGILHPADAKLAVEHGAAGIIVSNHGGRQLDTALPTIRALPAIADAVGGQIDVLIDGGIRRGTDVLKALARGANAVLIGRPMLWGLAVDGEHGARQVIDILRDEFDRALALVGCPNARAVGRDVIAEG
ncbi:MAG: alpha-hydroxy acid oxidase [Chloroflexota bacterium]|nr:alpha-hydroxy acid oxidase [Chloroflexota bacterium]